MIPRYKRKQEETQTKRLPRDVIKTLISRTVEPEQKPAPEPLSFTKFADKIGAKPEKQNLFQQLQGKKDPTLDLNFKPQPKTYDNPIAEAGAAFKSAALDSASFGLSGLIKKGAAKATGTEKYLKKQNESERIAREKNPIQAKAGEYAGDYLNPVNYLAPEAAVGKVFAKVGIKKATTKLGKAALEGAKGAIGWGALGAAEGAIRQEKPEDIAKRALTNAAFGSAVGAGGSLLTKFIPKKTLKLKQTTGDYKPGWDRQVQDLSSLPADAVKPEGNINSFPQKKTTLNVAQSSIGLPDTKQYIASKIKPTDTLGVKEKIGNAVKKTYESTVDDLYSIKSVSENAYKKALNTRQADMIAYRSLTSGLVDGKGNAVGESLKGITSKLPKGKELDFVDYLNNRHAPTWLEQGRKVFPDEAGVTSDIARAKASEYERLYPQFKDLGDKFTKYQQDLAKTWLVDSGIMPKETWKALVEQYPDYVPFQREFNPIERSTGINAKRGFVNQSSPIKKATGSQRKIIDPIETVIERTGQYIKTAKRNEVGQEILKTVRNNPEEYSGIIEIVPPKSAKASGEVIDDINSVLQKEGIDGLLDKFNQPWERQQFLANKGGAVEKGENIVTVLEKGAPVHLKVNDPDLLKALSNLNPQQATAITRAVGKATGVMKTLTTGINPVFGLARNVWRDLSTGYVNSKTIGANPLGYAQYIWDLTKAIGNTIAEPIGRAKFLPESFQELFKKGGAPMEYFKNIGGGGHVSAISGDRNLLAKAKADVLPKTTTQQFTGIPGKIYRGIENLNNTLEVAPRLAEAKRVLKKGGSADTALYEAQDLTVNFSRKGNLTKEADAFIPYLNAAVQGLDKTVRVFNPASVGGKNVVNSAVKAVYAITIPTIVLYAMNHNNKGYQQLSDYQKDNYFNLPNIDGTFIKIPKPRELGVIFGSLVERSLRAFKGKDPEAFNRFADTVKQNFVPPTEPVWQPAQDIWRTEEGRDWRGNPIVSQSMQDLSPRYQYDEKTSEPAKVIGNKLNLSPKKIDATAKSYLGGVGQLGIPATTKGGNVLNTLKAQVTADPLYNNDILNDFYSNLDRLKRLAADKNKLENLPTSGKANIVTAEEKKRNEFTKASSEISNLRKISSRLQSGGISGEDKIVLSKYQINSLAPKEKIIRDIQAQMIKIAATNNATLK